MGLTKFDGNGCSSDVPCHGRQEGDGMLGHCPCTRVRRVHHQAPALVRCHQIHIVYAEPGDSDNLQPPAGQLEDFLAHLRLAAHDQGLAESGSLAELPGIKIDGVVDD
ncbi:hypothetical protein EUGRSUZ_H03233, partial [Eucalyptus grandis]